MRSATGYTDELENLLAKKKRSGCCALVVAAPIDSGMIHPPGYSGPFEDPQTVVKDAVAATKLLLRP